MRGCVGAWVRGWVSGWLGKNGRVRDGIKHKLELESEERQAEEEEEVVVLETASAYTHAR